MFRGLFIVFATLVSAPAIAQTALAAAEGELRVLDKVTGEVSDLNLVVGNTQQVGLLTVTLDDCRVPRFNPSGDAFARVTVMYRDNTTPSFAGWLIASAPALHAMDHPRYDIWALRCNNS